MLAEKPLDRHDVRILALELLRRKGTEDIRFRLNRNTGCWTVNWRANGREAGADTIARFFEHCRVTYPDHYDDDEMVNPWKEGDS